MNKKLFLGATAVVAVAGAVAGAVYYRHVITAQLDKWLQGEDRELTEGTEIPFPTGKHDPEQGPGSEFYHQLTEEEVATLDETLRREGSKWTAHG